MFEYGNLEDELASMQDAATQGVAIPPPERNATPLEAEQLPKRMRAAHRIREFVHDVIEVFNQAEHDPTQAGNMLNP